MSCAGTPASPGLKYTSDNFAASSANLRVTCAGSPTGATVFHVASNVYYVKVPAFDVICPGPIEVWDGTTLVYCAIVTPC